VRTHHGLQITDQLFKSNLTFCIVCVFTLQTDEWRVHNRLFNATTFSDIWGYLTPTYTAFRVTFLHQPTLGFFHLKIILLKKKLHQILFPVFGLDSPLGLFPPGLDGCRNPLFDLTDPRTTPDSQLFVKKKSKSRRRFRLQFY
jgi:hypothetical protein